MRRPAQRTSRPHLEGSRQSGPCDRRWRLRPGLRVFPRHCPITPAIPAGEGARALPHRGRRGAVRTDAQGVTAHLVVSSRICCPAPDDADINTACWSSSGNIRRKAPVFRPDLQSAFSLACSRAGRACRARGTRSRAAGVPHAAESAARSPRPAMALRPRRLRHGLGAQFTCRCVDPAV